MKSTRPPVPAIPETDATRALFWRDRHIPHVDSLVARSEHSYPPSGSDTFRPELWKAAHWRWLYKDRSVTPGASHLPPTT